MNRLMGSQAMNQKSTFEWIYQGVLVEQTLRTMHQNENPPEPVLCSRDQFLRNYPSHALNIVLSFSIFWNFDLPTINYLRWIACIPSLISPIAQENKIKLEKTKKVKFMILIKMNWIWTACQPPLDKLLFREFSINSVGTSGFNILRK